MEIYMKLLECPVCFETVTSPVQTCDNGHATCFKCKNSLENCPVCKGSFLKHKNVLLDQLIDSVPLSCINQTNGCKEVINRSEKAEHEALCDYRLVKCPVFSCQTDVVSCLLYKHFKAHKPVTVFTNNRPRNWTNIDLDTDFSFEIKFKNSSPEISGLLFENTIKKYFCWRCIINKTKNMFTLGIQYIGKKEDADDFEYKIRVNVYKDPSVNFSFGGFCLPYMDNDEQMESHPKPFTVDLDKVFYRGIPSSLFIYSTIRLAN